MSLWFEVTWIIYVFTSCNNLSPIFLTIFFNKYFYSWTQTVLIAIWHFFSIHSIFLFIIHTHILAFIWAFMQEHTSKKILTKTESVLVVLSFLCHVGVIRGVIVMWQSTTASHIKSSHIKAASIHRDTWWHNVRKWEIGLTSLDLFRLYALKGLAINVFGWCASYPALIHSDCMRWYTWQSRCCRTCDVTQLVHICFSLCLISTAFNYCIYTVPTKGLEESMRQTFH